MSALDELRVWLEVAHELGRGLISLSLSYIYIY